MKKLKINESLLSEVFEVYDDGPAINLVHKLNWSRHYYLQESIFYLHDRGKPLLGKESHEQDIATYDLLIKAAQEMALITEEGPTMLFGETMIMVAPLVKLLEQEPHDVALVLMNNLAYLHKDARHKQWVQAFEVLRDWEYFLLQVIAIE